MMSRLRQAAAVVALTLAGFAMLLLVSPSANAAPIQQLRPVTPSNGHPAPVALASTGLDITTPVIVGLSTLLVGIAFVCWAFLRNGSAHRHH